MSSFWNRVLNGIGFSSDDGEEEVLEQRETPAYNEPPAPAVQRRPYTASSEEDYQTTADHASNGKIINYPNATSSRASVSSSAFSPSYSSSSSSSQVRGRTAVSANRQDIVVIDSFQQVNTVIDNLLDGITTNVNIEKLNAVDARRVLDVLGGAAYALQATHRCCGPNVYLVAPYGVEVEGEYDDSPAQPVNTQAAAASQGRYFRRGE